MLRLLCPALALLLAACSSPLDWTEPERTNVRHLVRSLAFAQRAAVLAATASTPPAVIAASLEAALVQAALVDESVLRKAHGELPKRWRREYQPALAALARHYRGTRGESGSDPSRRLNEFMHWYRSRQPEFRWWPGGPDDAAD